ncbi:hypothetical protein ACFTXJ_15380 [Streptomyces zhihengii]|uniref:hypothetical protein n=1 Tax=Streptomyces zhihengii TaxID=1818004 RepID=UPI00363FD27B
MNYVLGALAIVLIVGIMSPEQRRSCGAVFVLVVVLATIGILNDTPHGITREP